MGKGCAWFERGVGGYAPGVKRLLKITALAVALYAVATKSGRERVKRAQEAYSRKVTSGSRPIEAVGTAVAAFVGSDPGEP